MSTRAKSNEVTFIVNGTNVCIASKSHSNLLAYLRDGLLLTGTKLGCGTGNCGACSVLTDGVTMQSCQADLSAVDGSEITTVEQIVQTPLGREIADTLASYDAAQCGYCLPGIVVAAYGDISTGENSDPAAALQNNLCRCGTHFRILKALQEVVERQESST